MKNIKELQLQLKNLIYGNYSSGETQAKKYNDLHEDVKIACYYYMCRGILMGILVSAVLGILTH